MVREVHASSLRAPHCRPRQRAPHKGRRRDWTAALRRILVTLDEEPAAEEDPLEALRSIWLAP